MTAQIKRNLGKLAALLACMMVAIACMAPAAQATTGTYVLDQYGLLDSSEFNSLEAQAEDISSSSGVGTYLLIVSDIGGQNVREYAKNYYTTYNLGTGSDTSGILFLIAVNSRDYVTITHGKGVTIYTDYQIETMESAITDYLGDDEWNSGCEEYYSQCKTACDFYADEGTPLDSDNDPRDAGFKLALRLGIALLIAIAVMIFVRMFLKGQMKSVEAGHNADDYLQDNSLQLTRRDDRFITSNITKVPRPKDSGKGGGSSIDSGGFGGSGGGKF